MKVKICGLTESENAKQVAMLGVDGIGLVFYQKSPRYVDVQTACQIIKSLPPFISRVGLFVNAETTFIDEILCEAPLDTLQFHGNESAEQCEQYGLPYIKSVPMTSTTNLVQIAEQYHTASGLLLDTPSEQFGGTGQTFDWSLITQIDKPMILAGGLNPNNVANAIKQVQPYGVDVSSGVEKSKGIKDLEKVRSFLAYC